MPIETKEAPTQTPEEAKALEYNNAIQQLIDSGEIENGINKLSKAGKGAGRTRGHGETIQGKYGKQWNTSGSKPLSVVQREDGTKITTNADAAEWAEGRNSYYSKHHIITVEKDGRTLTFSKSAGAEPEISEEGELRRQSPLLSEYNKKTLQEN
jgi:hypothetical protein